MLISNEVAVKKRGWPKGKTRKPKEEVAHTAPRAFPEEAPKKAKKAVVAAAPKRLENLTGVRPSEFKVLIRPDAMKEKTKGGIIIPEPAREDQQRAVMKGTLVAVSPAAFSYHNWGEGEQIPQVGDRVVFARYSGSLIVGKDDVEYRLINDKDIGAIIDY
jgi:chaperonin GroES